MTTKDQISLCPESGRALIKALQDRVDDADTWLRKVNRLARPLPLGAHPVADAASARFQRFAGSEDEQSLPAVISAYREVLTQTCDAITTAMRNFREADARSAHAFARIHAEGR
ncbi:hypothetical protein Lesp02_01860 [Lentzea sp. NBRC 105346]|uniref:hypothetical protein n=1 Tax=Lentzea sp. NBRC 105346 TaxID=3032205 RepID=UPI0024A1FB84|nr:hypothetical protein [Lentzea sp. NBRC 105346]GLZ27996.1 hypothetical protein Lesp02_01860 [Lentzea sp. NBRC 105346]